MNMIVFHVLLLLYLNYNFPFHFSARFTDKNDESSERTTLQRLCTKQTSESTGRRVEKVSKNLLFHIKLLSV